jgi:hypothetical protein
MKQYVRPTSEIYEAFSRSFMETSNEQPGHMLGLTLEEPAPLKRLHPIFVRYEDLEPDIKVNLKRSSYAINYRMLEMLGIEYPFVIGTYKGKEDDICTCFYVQFFYNSGYVVYYNIYDLLETFLQQIRQKKDGEYHYNLTLEVRKKMPTFCKLLSNSGKNFKKPQYGLPMITFLDAESKYTLLAAGFNNDDDINEKTFETIHESLFTILNQLIKESNEAGILNQSIKQLAKNGLKLLLFARHLYLMP